jgi:hypothetical protein
MMKLANEKLNYTDNDAMPVDSKEIDNISNVEEKIIFEAMDGAEAAGS